ncbi:hypothetical protein [Cryobacterium tepidiphilum]|uniref:Uncharacterized protein n=1 Tax=Cryobacterium tepidiphilum TaxID=2486026 RepID=A0A3M8L2F1_9MICO|nr:hypothetical protein [Cryobacterium tepidiphilum]RNE59079.1 hypothetical protein EEJ31_11205 [Cryobacterium tepidiphilum]
MSDLTPPPRSAGRVLDAQLHLLDRTVLDRTGVPVTTVDALEITDIEVDTPIEPGTPAPVITALLSGPVLGTRIFGGRPPRSRLERIPWSDITDVGIVIKLGVDGDSLDLTWVERWMRDKIISRIPGGRHDPE